MVSSFFVTKELKRCVVKTIIGAMTLTILRNGLTIAGVPPSWSQIALGLLLIVAIAISLNRSKIVVVK